MRFLSKSIECWHGINHSPKYYPFEECKKVLIPFNLIFEKKVSINYVQALKTKGIKIMVDSGAANYYLNSTKEYPEGYLQEYLAFLEKVQPEFAFALDFCFEKRKFRNHKKLVENFHSQRNSIMLARSRGITLRPVVQGWNRESYQESAREVKKLLELFGIDRFGIGSICRAKEQYIINVLRWTGDYLNLIFAHGFGQTQRTIPILRMFALASLDTSNAASNAGNHCYNDPYGNWFVSPNSKQSNKRHGWTATQFNSRKEFYQFLFRLNRESLDFACNKVPFDWIHPVHGNRLDRYFSKEVTSYA